MYAKKCYFVTRERTPVYGAGTPDVLGVTAGRKLIEIEIKRSLSDFRANSGKFHIIHRNKFIESAPYQFYFLVPAMLVEKVKPELPEWAGLMSDEEVWCKVLVNAPVNKASKRLSPIQCCKLMRNISNHLCSVENKLDSKIEDAVFNSTEHDDIEYKI